MAGWTYGRFCDGCPNGYFCDWPCGTPCDTCIGKEYCDGDCNFKVGLIRRTIRRILYNYWRWRD